MTVKGKAKEVEGPKTDIKEAENLSKAQRAKQPQQGTKTSSGATNSTRLQPTSPRVSSIKMLAHRLSFSKHSLPKQQYQKHSNLSQSILNEKHKLRHSGAKPKYTMAAQQTAAATAISANELRPGSNGSFSASGLGISVSPFTVSTTESDNDKASESSDTDKTSDIDKKDSDTEIDVRSQAKSESYNPEDIVSSDSESEAPEALDREEDLKDYCNGGYHPTFVGERYGTRNQYLIVRKLGWGHFSTVWLAWDSLNDRHVAIKIVRSSKNYKEAAEDEIRILEKINAGPADHPGKKHVVELLDHFVHKGPNGEHVCMVFEVLGENMLSLLLRYKKFQKKKTQEIEQATNENGLSSSLSTTNSLEFHMSQLNDLTILRESYGGLPLTLVRQICKQLLLALDYLHRECGIIHTDLKPENVLVEIHDVEKLVKTLELERMRRASTHRGAVRQRGKSMSATATAIKNSGGTATPPVSPISHRSIRRTPIRPSRPLTTPVETSSSVENFFRSFSYGRPRSSTTPTSPGSGTFDYGSPQFLPKHRNTVAVGDMDAPTNPTQRNVTTRSSIDEVIDEEDEFVDAWESPVKSSDMDCSTDDSCNDNNLGDSTSLPITPPVSVTSPTSVASPVGAIPPPLYQRTAPSTLRSPHQMRRASSLSAASTNSILNDVSSVISVKIADLGNACWTDLHYTNDIQTRQYRAPEVILGGRWGCSTDMWSAACLAFELITGEYLFNPKNGSTYDKNDDHLALMIELLQSWPSRESLRRCKHAHRFFDKPLQSLKHITRLKVWTLPEVLKEEYFIDEDLANDISGFILAMLNLDPRRRVDAGSMSNHPWLQDVLQSEHVDRPYGLKGQDIPGYTNECGRRR